MAGTDLGLSGVPDPDALAPRPPDPGHTLAAVLLLAILVILAGSIFLAVSHQPDDSTLVRQLTPRPRPTSLLTAIPPGRTVAGESHLIKVLTPTPERTATLEPSATPSSAPASPTAPSTPTPTRPTNTPAPPLAFEGSAPTVALGAGPSATPRAATAPPSRATTPGRVAATAVAGGRVHIIAPGDTLYGLALEYGTTVEAIMAANGIADRNQPLRVGVRLVIPAR